MLISSPHVRKFAANFPFVNFLSTIIQQDTDKSKTRALSRNCQRQEKYIEQIKDIMEYKRNRPTLLEA